MSVQSQMLMQESFSPAMQFLPYLSDFSLGIIFIIFSCCNITAFGLVIEYFVDESGIDIETVIILFIGTSCFIILVYASIPPPPNPLDLLRDYMFDVLFNGGQGPPPPGQPPVEYPPDYLDILAAERDAEESFSSSQVVSKRD